MRLTCAIIDDEPLAVSLLESYVLKTPFLDLQGTYNSALDALSDLRDRPVDLLFLDIQMPYLERRYSCHLYDGFRSICRG